MEPDPFPHHHTMSELEDYCDGRLSDDAYEPVEKHLSECSRCREIAKSIAAVADVFDRFTDFSFGLAKAFPDFATGLFGLPFVCQLPIVEHLAGLFFQAAFDLRNFPLDLIFVG